MVRTFIGAWHWWFHRDESDLVIERDGRGEDGVGLEIECLAAARAETFDHLFTQRPAHAAFAHRGVNAKFGQLKTPVAFGLHGNSTDGPAVRNREEDLAALVEDGAFRVRQYLFVNGFHFEILAHPGDVEVIKRLPVGHIVGYNLERRSVADHLFFAQAVIHAFAPQCVFKPVEGGEQVDIRLLHRRFHSAFKRKPKRHQLFNQFVASIRERHQFLASVFGGESLKPAELHQFFDCLTDSGMGETRKARDFGNRHAAALMERVHNVKITDTEISAGFLVDTVRVRAHLLIEPAHTRADTKFKKQFVWNAHDCLPPESYVT